MSSAQIPATAIVAVLGEAADFFTQGITNAAGICRGGLDHPRAHCDISRYRVSPPRRRLRLNGGEFDG